MAILPAESAKAPAITPQARSAGAREARPLSARKRARRRALSRRRVRKLLAIRQRWQHLDSGSVWTVRQIHRKDWIVALQGPGQQPRYVRFTELGADYQLIGER